MLLETMEDGRFAAALAALFDLLAERGVYSMSNNKLCSSVTAAVVQVSLKPC